MTADKDILAVMVGTAGHVDHGKTSLVKRLTGFDTDRLKEEKARGMSIEMSVAPCSIEGVGQFGIIDVPGHEDFIRNMVAGASSIDVLMLVVAADDGVMPQTIEHLRILKLLGVSKLMVVLSKIDCVDSELLELVEQDVSDFLSNIGYQQVPLVKVSSETGEGFEQLREVLGELIKSTKASRDQRVFRSYVRHSFTVKGHGTVVTGVPFSGAVKAGETLELLPPAEKLGLRAVQNFQSENQSAVAHVSSALNLRDVQASSISRGMCLAFPGVYRSTNSAVAWVKNDSESFVLKPRRDLRFLAHTASLVSRLRLLSDTSIEPGQEGFVVLNFEEPVVLAAGDKFILRVLSPQETIGGGVILSANPGRVRRSAPNLIPRLSKAREALSEDDYFACGLSADGNPMLGGDRVSELTQRESLSALNQVADKVQSGVLIPIGTAQWFCVDRIEEVKTRILKILRRYHRENKYVWGIKPEYAASFLGIEPAGAAALAKIITESSKQDPEDRQIVLRHGYLAEKSFAPKISSREAKLREQTLGILEKQEFHNIAKGELRDTLQMSSSELKLVLRMLSEEGLIVVTGNYLLGAETFEQFKAAVFALFKEHSEIDLKMLREKTGMGRNLAVTLLEYLDNQGVTKRKGNVRVLVSPNN